MADERLEAARQGAFGLAREEFRAELPDLQDIGLQEGIQSNVVEKELIGVNDLPAFAQIRANVDHHRIPTRDPWKGNDISAMALSAAQQAPVHVIEEHGMPVNNHGAC